MSIDALRRGLRLNQWAKNTLIVIPAVAAQAGFGVPVVVRLGLGFLAFSLVASALYLANDIADADADRLHPTKRNRPFAAGEMPVHTAAIAAVALGVIGLALALALSAPFAGVLALYAAGSGAYTAALKRYAVIDVLTLTALYAARIVGGAVLVGVPLGQWFLASSVFLFASLAFLKRVIEARDLAVRYVDVIAGRGYASEDVPMLSAMGTASAAASALLYTLYITSDVVSASFDAPALLWIGLPLFLYWILRLWLLAGRGALREDAVAFATRDRASYIVLAVFLLMVLVAS